MGGTIRFRGGFPPRVIQLNDSDPISKDGLIRNNDMLHIELVDCHGNRISAASPSGNTTASCATKTNVNTKKTARIINAAHLAQNNKSPRMKTDEEWLPESIGDRSQPKQNIPLRRSSRERKPSERQYMLPPDD